MMLIGLLTLTLATLIIGVGLKLNRSLENARAVADAQLHEVIFSRD